MPPRHDYFDAPRYADDDDAADTFKLPFTNIYTEHRLVTPPRLTTLPPSSFYFCLPATSFRLFILIFLIFILILKVTFTT